MGWRFCTSKQKAAFENTIISLQRQKLKPLRHIFLPADSPVELTENIFMEENIH